MVVEDEDALLSESGRLREVCRKCDSRLKKLVGDEKPCKGCKAMDVGARVIAVYKNDERRAAAFEVFNLCSKHDNSTWDSKYPDWVRRFHFDEKLSDDGFTIDITSQISNNMGRKDLYGELKITEDMDRVFVSPISIRLEDGNEQLVPNKLFNMISAKYYCERCGVPVPEKVDAFLKNSASLVEFMGSEYLCVLGGISKTYTIVPPDEREKEK